MLFACAPSPSLQSANPQDGEQGNTAQAENAVDVCVIRPSHYRNSALIERLDSTLKPLNRVELPYAGLENAWGMPTVSDDVMYVVAQGVEGVRDARLVIGFDPATNETREYAVDCLALKSVAATDRYLFVTSVINNISTITRVDKQSAATQSIEFAGDFLVGITACGQKLAVLRQPGFDFSGDAELLILDKEMEIRDVVVLEGRGNANEMALVSQDVVCFGTFKEDATSSTQYHNTLNLYSLATGELRTIAESDYRYGFSAASEGRLVVLQSEINVKDGNQVLVFDLLSGEPLSQTDVDYMPQHLLVKDDLLYVAGFDQARGDYRLQQYRLDDDALSLITEICLDSTGLSHNDYGIGGLFFPMS
jgi:hypothetical protein